MNGNDKVDTDSISAKGELEVVKETKEAVVEVVHPWPEWIELMQRLVKQNYFDHRRKDEDRMIEDLGFDASKFAAEDDKVELDFTDYKVVQTACVNFGKDRFDILRCVVFSVVLENGFFVLCLRVWAYGCARRDGV